MVEPSLFFINLCTQLGLHEISDSTRNNIDSNKGIKYD